MSPDLHAVTTSYTSQEGDTRPCSPPLLSSVQHSFLPKGHKLSEEHVSVPQTLFPSIGRDLRARTPVSPQGEGGRGSALGELAIFSDILSAHGCVGSGAKSKAKSPGDSEAPGRADLVHWVGGQGTAVSQGLEDIRGLRHQGHRRQIHAPPGRSHTFKWHNPSQLQPQMTTWKRTRLEFYSVAHESHMNKKST